MPQLPHRGWPARPDRLVRRAAPSVAVATCRQNGPPHAPGRQGRLPGSPPQQSGRKRALP
eukprot:2145417-Alexandrium_andersonii.AAC.1